MNPPTAEDYSNAFEAERKREYPVIEQFEARMGYALDRTMLEDFARVLACPVKKNPPCWQHGRVIYSAARNYSETRQGPIVGLDIGTAKGFSALCVWFGIHDAGRVTDVTSVDVIDPCARISRNTVAEVNGLKTLEETLEPWPEAARIDFRCAPGIDWLLANDKRVHVAFVDGKHTGTVVAREGWLLSQRQESGDLCIFDDLHLPDIAKAVNGLREYYAIERIDVLPNRAYAVGIRK
jgi:hypothetical protein